MEYHGCITRQIGLYDKGNKQGDNKLIYKNIVDRRESIELDQFYILLIHATNLFFKRMNISCLL